MFKPSPLEAIQRQFNTWFKSWYFILLLLILLIGSILTVYVGRSQDAEMRQNLITYAKTIEKTVDWQPLINVINTPPEQINPADLKAVELQLNNACKANRDCHFIYLLYADKQQVKFLLDASPQPASEVSKMGEVFEEATDSLKNAMKVKRTFIEGPVTDHWGTWVSVRVPITATENAPLFLSLNIDADAANWNKRIFNKVIVPIVSMLIFSGILLWLIWQNRAREKLLEQMFNSTSVLSNLANNDPLTGLPNRRLLEDRMTQALKAAKRSRHVVAVMFLDLDHFKAVNDTHGHAVGDKLLKKVASHLVELLRVEDTVARIGGDEFIILLPRLKDDMQAIVIAEKIVTGFAKPFKLGDLQLQLGASLGIALYPQHGLNPKNLIKQADSAMYSAKRQGRGRYEIYTASMDNTSITEQ
jgi:diguanylate cyclase (GGDEF)-like protein